ncbi:MAG: class I SAM-dependent methyltransferase [Patescibacteria group bacterium]|nr:class I SAM-dependent methyltransferase [Patescibacteria group bacterium]
MLKNSLKEFQEKKRHTTMSRKPFYDIIDLPEKGSKILDIGGGGGENTFYKYLENKGYDVYCLDDNDATLNKIKNAKAIKYHAPNTIPIDQVDLIHCGHLIEHLQPQDLYDFLKQIDKVLKPGGTLVISAPMLWNSFYSDLSHIKPYNPSVIRKYLCCANECLTRDNISRNYTEEKLIFRYTDQDETVLGSEFFPVDFIIKLLTKIFKIKRYRKNGYTMILKKNK